MQSEDGRAEPEPDGAYRARRAIVVLDVVESVRLMQAAEAWAIERWRAVVQAAVRDILPARRGRLVKSLGDGMLLEFVSIADAVSAALAIQQLVTDPAFRDGPLALRLRAAIHVTELLVDELDVYGSGVNLAARLIGVATPGDIVISAEVRDGLADGLHGVIVDLGECHLKHWDEPVRVFRLLAPGAGPAGVPMPAPMVDARTSVAVVPFTPWGEHAASWGDALAEAIITALSGNEALRVVSLLSSQAFRGTPHDPDLIRRTLGVAYVVTGAYVVDGPRVHVDVKLCQTRDGQVCWAARRSVDGRGVFTGADTTMLEVCARIGFEIVRTEVWRARALPLSNLESYTLYIAGTYLLHRLSRRDAERARELLEHLAERHPRSPAPLAMLSKWHLLRAVQGWAPDRRAAGRIAQACARRALDLDPDHALALSMDAIVVAQVDGDLQRARQIGEAAVSANPQESHAWLNLGGIHSYLGHGQDAAAMPQRAIELSPVDPARFAFDAFLAEGQLTARRFDAAAAAARSSIRLNAMHASSHRILTTALALAGKIDEARRAAADLMRLDPAFRVGGYQRSYPGRDLPHFAERLEALRAAGVPE